MRRVFQLVALGAVLTFTAAADNIVMTAESFQNQEEVLNYFSGRTGSLGSGPGPADGVTFTSNFTAFLSADDGGIGTFAGNPNGDMAFTFVANSQAAVMDVPLGFTTGLAFEYAELSTPESIYIYSGIAGTGTLLATLALPVTGNGFTSGNPACQNSSDDQFCPFTAIGVDFAGTAESVVFTETEGQVALDALTLGSDVPGVSEPGALKMLGLGLACLLVASRRLRKLQQNTGQRLQS
jgi:hypothetical protein